MQGLDYAWTHPSASALKKADIKFVCRYLSNDSGKNISAKEANALINAGISIVLVWEADANRALDGYNAGKSDASKAKSQAKNVGQPDNRPIYFAVDFDAGPDDQSKIDSYLKGAASVIGKNRVGIYAGYYPAKRSLDNDTAEWAWQTYAWSEGKLDKRAHIHQYENGVKVGGVSVDKNKSLKSDFGQWPISSLTKSEIEEMPEYISLTTSKPITLKAGTRTRIKFDKVYANTTEMTVGKNAPGIVNSTEKAAPFILKTAHIPENVVSRLIEVDDKKYEIDKEYDDENGNLNELGMKNADNHLYLECHSAVEVSFTPIVKVDFWI